MQLFDKIFSPEAFSVIGGYCITFVKNLIVAAIVFWIGRWVIGKVQAGIVRVLTGRKAEPSVSSFLQSVVSVVLHVILVVILISIFGIETSSFIALFASAGMAVGMALSGTLQNFAGGVIIMVFRPYRVGNFIEAAGYAGTVREIQMFNTILTTTDNQTIIIPNSTLSNSSMKNYSTEPYRRVDVKFQVAYGSDLDEVRSEILQIQMDCPKIIKKPLPATSKARGKATASVAAPWCRLTSLDESGITLTTRSWCRSADYWDVYFYLTETVYQRLKESGFMFPFNRMDVSIIGEPQREHRQQREARRDAPQAE